MKRTSLCLLTILALALTTSLAEAQDDYSRIEVFGGYSMIRPNLQASGLLSTEDVRVGEEALGNVHGWGSSITLNLNRSFGVTADFNGSYKNLDVIVAGYRIHDLGKVHSFLFGPTFTLRTERVRPFAHVLAGVARASSAVTVVSTRVSKDVDRTGVAAAIGGGVDIGVGSRISLRAFEVDYFPYRPGDGQGSFLKPLNNLRWRSGLVFHF